MAPSKEQANARGAGNPGHASRPRMTVNAAMSLGSGHESAHLCLILS
jgi:hypothetical protein